MSDVAERMFVYLRDMIYAPENAALDTEKLPEDFKQLGEGLLYLGKSIDELRGFSSALAKGNLSVDPPPRDNELAASLKSLHASLRHISWQSQQVAKGDYGQTVSFMGEFAEAFNTMTNQLDQRQKALLAEIESGHKKTLALEQSISLLEAVTDNIPQLIVVLDSTSCEELFLNRAAQAARQADAAFAKQMEKWLVEQTKGGGVQGEDGPTYLTVPFGGKECHFAVASYPMSWHRHNALAFVLSDVSAERERVHELEMHAYSDTLTRLNNRYYGMQVLRDWVEEGREFCICFADLDNLKYVNDTYGHHEGDNYIIAAADLLTGVAPGAVVCRLGGDEFMVLLPGSGEEAARERMHRVFEDLESWGAEGQGPYRRSISYGVVGVCKGNTLSASDLLSAADERMYAFKRRHKRQRKVLESKE